MATADKPQKPLSSQLDAITLLIFAVTGLAGMHFIGHPGNFSRIDIVGLIGLGVIGIFRWSWFIVRVIRSRIYLHWVFPRWRRAANRIPVEALPHMCFLVPTYKEQPWITERVFRAIAQEARTLVQPITLLVNSSGDEENAAIRAVLEVDDLDYARYIHLIQMTQKDGKRKAMADALRKLATLNLPPDTVIALMDGDSELAPGTLRQCLPFFRLFPEMGALTTDELPLVKGSYWFSEWFHLRFAQRHYQMCSESLSHKVMCLTGRFSLFRAETALDPSFAGQLESDTLNDWLWGRFQFLSGDDKSTWFWLLRRGFDMLYIPDALVYSIETLSGGVIDRAYQNMRRWYGNMLRNNGRAIAIGPRILGWFTWYSLIDQRISIWTSLLTPGFLVVALVQGNWKVAGLILCWIVFSRTVMLWIVFWWRDSYLKLVHLPILLLTQWSSSLVKIWTQMNLARQSWTNRGNQSISAEGTGSKRALKLGTSRLLLLCQLFAFGIFLCWLAGVLNPMWDLVGLWLNQKVAQQPKVQVVEAGDRGIIPNDNRDDAKALQALIDRLPSDRPV
ncbi:glycosyltransferase [Leptothermofonsia sp. ETS-13]|uniref:glycosyltransferase n=1 Tax=Leptothermofonsia sp. ETS-13 TaxID=3035696 RepID=UPI003B9E4020